MIQKKPQFLKSACLVTFSLPIEIAGNAKTVHLVGDFNEWSHSATPMTKGRSGAFSVSIKLASGNEYQFRYLIDGHLWANDAEADKHVPTLFGDSENSAVVL